MTKQEITRFIIDDVLDGLPARNSIGEIVGDYAKIQELEGQLEFYRRRYARNYQEGIERKGVWNGVTNEVDI